MNLQDIPRAWINFLREVQTMYPHAIIAGGCLRDLDYGKSPDQVKDVDIFIPRKDFPDSFRDSAIRLLKQFGYVSPAKEQTEAEKEYTEAYMQQTQEGRAIYGLFKLHHEGFNYDIIFGSDRTATIDDFDFSICQIGTDGGTVFTTPEYDKTKADRTIVLVNARPAHRTNDRIERMKMKFPDMTVKAMLDEIQDLL